MLDPLEVHLLDFPNIVIKGPRPCRGAFTSLIRLVSTRRGRGWFLFRVRAISDRVERPRRAAQVHRAAAVQPGELLQGLVELDAFSVYSVEGFGPHKSL